jgi:hypothetical protein
MVISWAYRAMAAPDRKAAETRLRGHSGSDRNFLIGMSELLCRGSFRRAGVPMTYLSSRPELADLPKGALRKFRDTLRLKHELGISERLSLTRLVLAISASCHGDRSGVDAPRGHDSPVIDPITGAEHGARIFVAALGASNYTYAEARWTPRRRPQGRHCGGRYDELTLELSPWFWAEGDPTIGFRRARNYAIVRVPACKGREHNEKRASRTRKILNRGCPNFPESCALGGA